MPFKFQVIATNYQGQSLPSASVRILAAVVPDAPASPILVSASKTQITIRWNPPTQQGGVPVESYNIYSTPAGGAFTLSGTVTDLSDLSF